MIGLALRRMLAAGSMLATIAGSGAAFAQTAEDKAAAETLFEDGKRLMHDKRFAEACPKLAESLHLDPGIGTMLWLADCYEKTGRIASAWAEFREAAESAAREHDTREKVARERAAKLESRLPRLTLVVPAASQVDGLEMKRDAEVVDKAVWGTEVPVDPGSHLLAASAPHRKPWQRSVELQEGHTLSVVVPPLDNAPSEPSGPAAVVTSPTSASLEPESGGAAAGNTQRILGLAVGGLGVVGIAAGAYFGLRAKSSLDDSNANGHCTSNNLCDPAGTQSRNDAKSSALISTVAFIAGGAALAGGVALYLTAPKGPKRHVAAGLVALPVGGSLFVVGTF